MSYSIDRNHTLQPSLAEMTHFALEALDANSEKGFFLLIEGSRIDLASHSNDPVGHVHDVLAFNAAFDVARQFVEQTPGAVLISTSDHETGGISIGRQVAQSFDYFWFPEVLANASHSTEFLGRLVAENEDEDIRPFLEKAVLEEGLGIMDATEEELALLIEKRKYPVWADFLLADMISLRARIGVLFLPPNFASFPLVSVADFGQYSTHGHTAVDVNIYAAGDPLARETLRGNHENTEIGGFIRQYLDLDLEAVTEILNAHTHRFEGIDTLGDERDEFLVQREIDRRYH
jgi:alkaline phosphatase